MNLQLVKQILKFDVESILDIGANVGEFSVKIHEVFPTAKIHMVEANYHCEEYLKNLSKFTYSIELLSDTEKTVQFYTNKKNKISTGNSYYLENTHHFSEENLQIETRITKTLDTLFPNKKFDFIKLDTQGSELDIINGGIKCIGLCRSLLIECSTQQYNIGSPLIDLVVQKVNSLGFVNSVNVTDINHVGQLDILFWR